MIAKRLLAIQKSSYGSGGGGVVIPSTDVYYDYRSLILNMQGASGSTTFTDSSPNNFTVTPYGNAQLASDATFGTVASFDGNGDRLNLASNTAFGFGTGDFTVEFWVYFNSVSTSFVQLYDTYVSGGFSFYWSGSTSTLIISNRLTNQLVQAWAPSVNTWYHIAVSRFGTNLKLFVNGTVLGSATNSISYSQAAIQIGGTADNANYTVNGKIGPLRISPWAVYTSNFTPSQDLFPAAPDSIYANPYYDKVALSLKFDGTNGSTSFVDTGPNAFAVTPYGNAQITSASKYGSGAGAFDGNGDYLETATASQLNLGTSDFTIECWFKLASTTNNDQGIINDTKTSFSSGSVLFKARQASGSGKICFQAYDFSSIGARIVQSTTIPAINTWYHVALVRTSGSVKLYVNGTLESTGTFAGTVNFNNNNGTRVGHSILDGANGYFNGSIDELEVTPGVAKYKANFTPPVRGLSTIYNPYTTLPVSGAALWLDGADSSTLFTDAGVTPVAKSGDLIYQWSDKSGNNRHATQATSANRPTWVPPASGRNGLGAVSFSGSQWIDCGNSTNYNFGSSDFTIEGWFNLSTTSQPSTFIAKDLSGNRSWILFYQSSNSTINFVMFGTSTKTLANAYSAVANTWFHAAVVRSGNTVLMFINGVLQPNTLDVTGYSPAANTSAIRLGMHYSSTNGYNMKGQIQNAIIWPQALYTSNFTPWMS